MKPIGNKEMRRVAMLERDSDVQTEDSLSVMLSGMLLW
jgi:hypothetical protein